MFPLKKHMLYQYMYKLESISLYLNIHTNQTCEVDCAKTIILGIVYW